MTTSSSDTSLIVGSLSATYTPLNRWLCHPDQSEADNVCVAELDVVSVAADGTATVQPFRPAEEPAFDCFYAYPTASLDPGANSNFFPGPQERKITQVQFAAYGATCRTFAPVYRQRTLTNLAASVLTGRLLDDLLVPSSAAEIAYADIKDAFLHYLADQNNGRGFLLVGHSQGASQLRRLIAEVIESGVLLRDRLIGAHLMGSTVAVPLGADIGGSFATVPACRHEDQFGCVVSYASYRQGDLQLSNPLFGTTADPSTQAICTHPAALAGGAAGLDSRLPIQQPPAFQTLLIPRGSGGPYDNRLANLSLAQPYYAVPGQIIGECVVNETGASYLEIRVQPEPNGPRADDYPGEFLGGTGWGLHLIDVSLALGDLVRLAERQASAWASAQ